MPFYKNREYNVVRSGSKYGQRPLNVVLPFRIRPWVCSWICDPIQQKVHDVYFWENWDLCII